MPSKRETDAGDLDIRMGNTWSALISLWIRKEECFWRKGSRDGRKQQGNLLIDLTCHYDYLSIHLSIYLPHCGILVLWPVIEPGLLAVKAQSPYHWTTSGISHHCVLLWPYKYLVREGFRTGIDWVSETVIVCMEVWFLHYDSGS